MFCRESSQFLIFGVTINVSTIKYGPGLEIDYNRDQGTNEGLLLLTQYLLSITKNTHTNTLDRTSFR